MLDPMLEPPKAKWLQVNKVCNARKKKTKHLSRRAENDPRKRHDITPLDMNRRKNQQQLPIVFDIK